MRVLSVTGKFRFGVHSFALTSWLVGYPQWAGLSVGGHDNATRLRKTALRLRTQHRVGVGARSAHLLPSGLLRGKRPSVLTTLLFCPASDAIETRVRQAGELSLLGPTFRPPLGRFAPIQWQPRGGNNMYGLLDANTVKVLIHRGSIGSKPWIKRHF